MTDTTGSGGHQCPECGTPKSADGSPSCDCNRRTADALRDARTAEQAAAEDFDPLRIRPYIDIERAGGAETEAVRAVGEPTIPLPAVTGPAPEPVSGVEPPDAPEEPRRRSRRTLLLAVAGAVVAVLAAAGFVSGLFARLTPERDGAAPQDVRESVPDVPPSTASPSVAAPTTSRPSESASASASASPSRSAAASSAPPSPTDARSATPTRSTPTATASATAQPSSPAVLRPGDSGAQVTELQLRLKQVGLYSGDADGHYDSKTESAVRTYQLTRGILTDESGVYGAATRAALESETTKP
ncbi:MAG: peptidoglycan-binding protein [Streptomyces sp.]|uniref:peptidoglycan-binding domain-containing protein n=1 Tax=Streptomyces sp. TaxID=1931 RepID=UPI0025F748E9|nr:peptidoglycan-binding domain-containing protein [Streptomyces sp.]MBW8796322.1 peptidoglycan-binding protein [Streptomyces sp.]